MVVQVSVRQGDLFISEKSKVVELLLDSAPATILVIRGAALYELSIWRIRPI
jgi:hypothetical protein